jgi:PncC family amidohydrolase
MIPARRAFTVFGVSPSEIEAAASDLPHDVTATGIQVRRVRDGSTITVSSTKTVREAAAYWLEWLATTFGAQRVARGTASLAALVADELRSRSFMIAAAESCTGGMFGERITSVAGSSSVFWGSIVSYADEAKRTVLGVREDTLARYGAVSEAVVSEMARGVRALSGAHMSVAISGIAGPDGGTREKPVGTVWLACDDRGEVITKRFHFDGDRGRIRRDAVVEALLLIRGRYHTG